MKPDNVLSAKNRNELRQWLEHNHLTEKECWVAVKRGRPTSDDVFWYVDAVEEQLSAITRSDLIKRSRNIADIIRRISPQSIIC